MEKLKFFLVLGLMAVCLFSAQTTRAAVTHLHIETLYGGEQQLAITKIGKIVFGTNEICLFDATNTEIGCTSLSQIGHIVFEEHVASDIDEVAVSGIHVYPNPTQDVLFIRGIEGEQTVRIYSLQGQLLQSAVATDGEAELQVGGLQDGTYLLQIGAQVVKIIKD